MSANINQKRKFIVIFPFWKQFEPCRHGNLPLLGICYSTVNRPDGRKVFTIADQQYKTQISTCSHIANLPSNKSFKFVCLLPRFCEMRIRDLMQTKRPTVGNELTVLDT